MTEKRLGIRETAAMIALMSEAKEVSNPDLEARVGFSLTGEQRRKLNDRKLVESRMVGRSYVHQLTDAGWKWCRDELSATCPPRAGSAGRALYALLGGLRRYLDRANLELADVFVPDGEMALSAPVDVESRIRSAYRSLSKDPRDWVGLADLRRLLRDIPRQGIDAALVKMSRARTAILVPESNQKVLTKEDQDAALRIGGEDNHLIAIEA